jgi:hypothetical protein
VRLRPGGPPPDPIRSCEWTEDCMLVTDCCVCDAVNVTYTGEVPGACPDVDCDEPQCMSDGMDCAVCRSGGCVTAPDPARLARNECEDDDDCELRSSCCACYAASRDDPTDPETCCPDIDCYVDQCTAEGVTGTQCLFTAAGVPGRCALFY